METHSLRGVSREFSKTQQKLCVSIEFSHKEIRLNFDILCSVIEITLSDDCYLGEIFMPSNDSLSKECYCDMYLFECIIIFFSKLKTEILAKIYCKK